MAAKFGLIGLGYISKRHINAIESAGHQLAVVYTPERLEKNELPTTTKLITSESEFFDFVKSNEIKYISICSPSHFHCDQIIKSLQLGCTVIVEKPICLSLSELEKILQAEIENNQKVFSIFQLRNHPVAIALAKDVEKREKNKVKIIYRGNRSQDYFSNWKGNLYHSGGIFAAVGLHYFDLLTLHFGQLKTIQQANNSNNYSAGSLSLEHADVEWKFEFMPLEKNKIEVKREFIVNGKSYDFSTYAQDLHTIAYKQILENKGIDTTEALKTVEILEAVNKEY